MHTPRLRNTQWTLSPDRKKWLVRLVTADTASRARNTGSMTRVVARNSCFKDLLSI